MRRLTGLLKTIGLSAVLLLPNTQVMAGNASNETAYDFTFKKLEDGSALPLSEYRGKVLLIVNTASRCGFTPQYEGLEKLYERYKAQGLVVLGVPSNDFADQEPGTDAEIRHFCQSRYAVSFPMTSRESVVGNRAHPFYKWARGILGFAGTPKWNFHKYLIGRQGRIEDYFYSTTAPDSRKLEKAVEKALAEK